MTSCARTEVNVWLEGAVILRRESPSGGRSRVRLIFRRSLPFGGRVPALDDWKGWAGLWGAAVATVLAVLRGWEWRHDRGQIRLSIGWHLKSPKPNFEEMKAGAPLRYQPVQVWASLVVTNVGRRTVVVQAVGAMTRDGWRRLWRRRVLWSLATEAFPHTLAEGEPWTVPEASGLIRDSGRTLNEILGVRMQEGALLGLFNSSLVFHSDRVIGTLAGAIPFVDLLFDYSAIKETCH